MLTWLSLVFAVWASTSIARPITVVLDPGHGGENRGAPSRHHPHHFEKDFTLPIAKYVKANLEALGMRVVLTRYDDREVSLLERVSIANQAGGDALVSIHLNSSKRIGPSGPMTFLLSAEASAESNRRIRMLEEENPSIIARHIETELPTDSIRDILLSVVQQHSHARSVRLAESIQQHLERHSPFKGRGIRQAPFYVLMGVSMPAVVAEIGFINHPQEGKYITSPSGMKKIAAGITEGIIHYQQRSVPYKPAMKD